MTLNPDGIEEGVGVLVPEASEEQMLGTLAGVLEQEACHHRIVKPFDFDSTDFGSDFL